MKRRRGSRLYGVLRVVVVLGSECIRPRKEGCICCFVEGLAEICIQFLLIFDWALVAQRRIFAISIVEDFDVFECVSSYKRLSLKYPMTNRGTLLSSVKRFHRGVIVTVAFGTHTGFKPKLCQ